VSALFAEEVVARSALCAAATDARTFPRLALAWLILGAGILSEAKVNMQTLNGVCADAELAGLFV
jgi:hypothetical protein